MADTPREGLDFFGVVAHLLGDGRLSPSSDVGVEAQQPEGRECEQGGDDEGGQPRVAAHPLAQLVEKTRSAGGNWLAGQEPPQIFGQCAGRVVAPVLVLLEALENDGLEIDGNRSVEAVRRNRVALDDPGDDLGIGPGVRALAGQKPIESGAQAIDVGAPVEPGCFATHLFGRAERRCAEHHAGDGQIVERVDLAGNPEIHHVGVPAPVELALHQHVGGFDVAVDESRLVRRVQAIRHVDHDGHLVAQSEEIGDLLDGAARDVLHGDVGKTVHLANLVDLAEVFVVDLGLDPGLANKALDLFWIVAAQELQGHVPAETWVASLEDVAHASPTDELDELVAIPVGDRKDFEGVAAVGICGAVGIVLLRRLR
jgi:hypothetical protein